MNDNDFLVVFENKKGIVYDVKEFFLFIVCVKIMNIEEFWNDCKCIFNLKVIKYFVYIYIYIFVLRYISSVMYIFVSII